MKTARIDVAENRLGAHTRLCRSLQRDPCGPVATMFAPTFIQPMALAYHQDPVRLDGDFRCAFGPHFGSFFFARLTVWCYAIRRAVTVSRYCPTHLSSTASWQMIRRRAV